MSEPCAAHVKSPVCGSPRQTWSGGQLSASPSGFSPSPFLLPSWELTAEAGDGSSGLWEDLPAHQPQKRWTCGPPDTAMFIPFCTELKVEA